MMPTTHKAHVRAPWIILALTVALVGSIWLGVGQAAAAGLRRSNVRASFAAKAAPCKPTAVSMTVSTNRATYGPGAIVSMTASVKNKTSRTCSLVIGPTSPSFTVTNSSGASVWDNCDVHDQPGSCALYLIVRDLKPGATYARTVGWDQRSGSPSRRVPAGKYTFTIRFVRPRGARSARFALAA